MPIPLRAALSLFLNLSFITAAVAQSHSVASTPMRVSAAEEESLRTLTAEYGRALVAGDLDAIRKFWNPQSSNLPAQFRSYKNVFAHARLEFISPEVTRLEITGDKAVSHLTVDERRLDKKTDAVLPMFDPLRGACRSFEWIRTNSGWRLEREFLVQDELASKLEAARSDQERDEILEKEKRFVNFALGRFYPPQGGPLVRPEQGGVEDFPERRQKQRRCLKYYSSRVHAYRFLWLQHRCGPCPCVRVGRNIAEGMYSVHPHRNQNRGDRGEEKVSR